MPAKPISLSRAPVIAIVDDDEAVRDALSNLLLVLDLSCRTFDRAETFMAAYARGSFDCLVTDVSMPGQSGLDLMQVLRSLDSSIPVIIVTADANPTTRSRAMEGGAHAYLTKPINTEAFACHVRAALRHRTP
jgi:two-component system, LuxR family, response regulator FixJ